MAERLPVSRLRPRPRVAAEDQVAQLRVRPLPSASLGCRRPLLHRTRLSLAIRFRAACLMATHCNGISALQLQKRLGVGSCRSAWMFAAKLRRALATPERSPEGKMPVAGAVELGDGNTPGRLRQATVPSCSVKDLGNFAVRNTAATAIVKTDGRRGFSAVPRERHRPHVVGDRPAHEILAWIHTAFSNLKGWARGVCHGLHAKRLQTCLGEFVFRFNRRRNRHAAFSCPCSCRLCAPNLTPAASYQAGTKCISS